MSDGREYFRASIDTSQFERDASNIRSRFRDIGNVAENEGMRIDSALKNIGRTAAGVFGGIQVTSFIKDIVRVRSEFQNTEAMFKVFLGSAEKASSFMKEIQGYAFSNVFEFKDLTQQAAQLLAYGTEAEKVVSIIDKLSNVAAGVNQPLERFVELYNKAKSRDKLDQTDIQQWSVMGDVVSYLADMLEKSRSEIRSMISEGKIGFKEMDQLLTNLTSSGGKFSGMMEEKMKTLGDSVGLLEDTITSVLNEIGEKSQDVLRSGILLANDLVENYETIGEVLIGLIATYGTYKAAIIALNVVQRIQGEMALQAAIANTTLTTSQQLGAVASRQWSVAMAALNRTMLANPAVLLTAAVLGLAFATYKLATYQTESEKAQSRLNDAIKEAEKEAIGETRELAKLKGELSATKKGTEEYNAVKEKIIKNYGKYYKGLEDEIEKVGLLDSIYKKLTESIMKSFGARQYDKFIKAEYDNLDNVLNENLSKIQDRIYNKFEDKEAAAKYFANIRNALIEGRELSKSSISVLDYIQDKGTIKADSRVDSYVKKIRDAQRITEDIDKKAKERFGIKEVKGEDGGVDDTTKSFATLSDQIDSTRKNVASLKKELQDLKSGKTPSEDYAKAIEDKAKDLKTEEDKLNYLLYGKNTSDISKGESAAEKARKEAQKIADDQLKIDNDKIKAELDARNARLENRQEEINLMEDSFAKEQAQLDLNHKKELLAIDKRTQDLIEKEQERRRAIWNIANPNGAKTPYKTDVVSRYSLSASNQSEIETSEDIANQKQLKATDDLLKSLLAKYQDYNTQRLEINKKYQADLTALEAYAPSPKRDASIAHLKKQWSEALSSINLEEFQDQIDWSVLFSNLDKISTDELVKLRDKLKIYLSSVGSSLSPKDLKTVTDAFEGLNEKIADKKPIGELKDGYDEYRKAIKDVASAQEALNYLVKVGGKDSVAYKIEQDNLTNAQNRRRESLVKISQSINKIGSVGSQMVNSGEELVDMLTNVGIKIPEAVKGALSGIGQVMGGLEKIDLTKPASIISSTVSIISGLGNTIASIFGGGKNKSQKDTERLQEVTSRIEASNEAINKLIEKRISLIKESTAAEGQYLNQLTQEQIKQQQQFVESQFNNVKGNWLFAKKGKNNNLSVNDVMRRYGLNDLADFVEWWNSGGYQELLAEGQGFVDKDMWNSIINSWTELGEAAKNAETAMKEAATGTTFDALKDSLDDLVQSADTTFEDISDSFEDHMRNAVMNFVKSSYLTNALQQWYDKFAEAYSDDVLSQSEVDELRKMYEEAYNKAQNIYDAALGVAGLSKESNGDTRTSTAKGIATASQDSVDYLSGLWTLSVEHTRSISENVTTLRDITANISAGFSELRSNIGAILRHVQNIDSNTNLIKGDISMMREDINSLVLHGVTLKK